MMWPLCEFRMHVWNVLHAAGWNTGRTNYANKSPSGHHRTTLLSGNIFAIKACIDNRKKNLLNSNIFSRSPHNMVNFGPLTVASLGTPANFNGFRVLALLLHRSRSTEVNQTLHDVWPPPGLVHYYIHLGGLLPPNRILPGAKFTLRPSLAFSYIGSVTARHSSSGRQSNFEAWYLHATGRPSSSTLGGRRTV